MDEKNLNPIPEKPVEDENEEVLNSEAEASTDDVAVTEEPATEDADQAEIEEENADGQTDEEEQSDSDAEEESVEETEEAAEPAKPVKKKKKGLIALLVVLILVLVGSVSFMIAAIVSTMESSLDDLDEVVVSVEDVDSTAAEFYQNYMYYYSYNSYYGYTEEELKDLVVKQLVLTNGLYADAVKAGYSINEDDQAAIDEQIASLTSSAESYSLTVEEYLNEYYGDGFTLEIFTDIVTRNQLAQRYYTDKYTEIEEKYALTADSAEAKEEYEANKADYDLCDVSYFYLSTSDENAKADADAVADLVKNGSSFEDAIVKVTGDSEDEAKELSGHTQAYLTDSGLSEDAINWIFEKNSDGTYKNGAGAATVVETESMVYVYYVNAAPARNETHAVTAYYIKVDISDDMSVKTEEELKIEAESTARSALKKFEETDKSADSFTALIEEYNSGDNSLIYGDTLSEMLGDGTYDASVELWAFDEARTVGDYALIDCGDDGYYIVFYAERSENPEWLNTIIETKLEEAYLEFENSVLDTYEPIAVINDDAILEITEYVATLAASYGS